MRDTEEDLAVMGCLDGTAFCRIEGCCVLRNALREATLAFWRLWTATPWLICWCRVRRLAHSLGIGPDAARC